MPSSNPLKSAGRLPLRTDRRPVGRPGRWPAVIAGALLLGLAAPGDLYIVRGLGAQNAPAAPRARGADPAAGPARPENPPGLRNVVLIVLDGIRTEEFFIGVSPYAARRGPGHARERLFPFLWGRLAGSANHTTRIFGDRFGKSGRKADYCRVDNNYGISLPAYADLLGGVRQPAVRSNQFQGRLPNPTVPDRLLKNGLGENEMAIFSSWKHIASVVSAAPPVGFHVDTGRRSGDGRPRWKDARYDRDLQKAVMAYLRDRERRGAGPLRFLFLAYNDSDEWAHIGDYGRYIRAIRRQDAHIRELYEYLESRAAYREQTLYIITTDHGRGRGRHWKSHGRVPGSQYVWALIHSPGQPGRLAQLAESLEQRCSHTALGALAFAAASGGDTKLARSRH